ncbi:hypothetical protein ACI2VF_15040 [Ralstonia nicotianae]
MNPTVSRIQNKLFRSMPTSTVFVHPTRRDRKVKVGFCWSALLFGTLWAYSERLIAYGGRLVAVDGFVGLMVIYGDKAGHPSAVVGALFLFIAKNFYCAVCGHRWLRSSLLQQGYRALNQKPDSQVSYV